MQHATHGDEHAHVHGEHCGHLAVSHEGHIDYLHNGHLHYLHGDHYDEHIIAVDAANPVACAPITCTCDHKASGHERVPHGDHFDYLCDGKLHHCHGDHCDDHGSLVAH
jgi:hypothetical protein